MGYYTHHNLSTDSDNYELIEEFREANECARFAIDCSGDCEESCKWYSHEIDLRSFSKLHPEVLFTLKGEGEEAGDIWVEYYKNGLMQRVNAKLVFDEYDESLLK
jgi:hypothetical protein